LLKHCDILKKCSLLQGSIRKIKDTDDINIGRYNLPEFSPSPYIVFTYYTGQYVAFLTTERTDSFESFLSLISWKGR